MSDNDIFKMVFKVEEYIRKEQHDELTICYVDRDSIFVQFKDKDISVDDISKKVAELTEKVASITKTK